MSTTLCAYTPFRILVFLALVSSLWSPLIPRVGQAHAAPAEAGSSPLRGARSEGSAGHLAISLQQAIMLALENNMDLRVERLNPLIREAEVKREEGAFFSPRASFELGTDRTQRPTGSVLAGTQIAEISNVDGNAGVSMRSVTGGVVSLDFRNKRFESNSAFQLFDPQYTADLALTVTHPLLKNFGVGVNRIRLKVAQNSLEITKHQLRATVTNLIAEVQQAYWDLVLATYDLAVRRQGLELAEHLHRRAEALEAAGRLPAIAVLQAKTGILEREIDRLTGENNLADAQQRLKALLNLDKIAAPADLVIEPTDTPSLEPQEVSIEAGIKTALTNRPELSQSMLDQESRSLSVKLARNQLLPELNFVGSVGLSGLSGTPSPLPLSTITIGGVPVESFLPSPPDLTASQGGYSDAVERMFSGDFLSYRVGISVQIPLGNRAARSELTKARLEMEKAKLLQQSLEQKIALEVERVGRGLTTIFKGMEGARVLRELAQRKLQMAQDGLELGISSVTDVLESQKTLALAQRDELKAIIEYNKMLALWEKVTGTALERFDITL